jgi:Domain of unknown function (DUF4158)
VARLPENFADLVEHWTLLPAETNLLAGKHDGATKLAFALLLKFYGRYGRFPRGRAELRDEAVEFVAAQVKAPASDLGFYEWNGPTIKRHRGEIRRFFGFRNITVADQDKRPTGWPVTTRSGSGVRSWCASSSWPSAGPANWSHRHRGRSTGSWPVR